MGKFCKTSEAVVVVLKKLRSQASFSCMKIPSITCWEGRALWISVEDGQGNCSNTESLPPSLTKETVIFRWLSLSGGCFHEHPQTWDLGRRYGRFCSARAQ